MIDKIQEKIDKYENIEDFDLPLSEFRLIGNFLEDLQELLKAAKEKKKACCDKKAAKQIIVTACRNCPYLMSCAVMPDYCNHPELKEIGGRVIDRHDIVPDWCNL